MNNEPNLVALGKSGIRSEGDWVASPPDAFTGYSLRLVGNVCSYILFKGYVG